MLSDEIEEAGLVHRDDGRVGLERNRRRRARGRADNGKLSEHLARSELMEQVVRLSADVSENADRTRYHNEELVAFAAFGEDQVVGLVLGEIMTRHRNLPSLIPWPKRRGFPNDDPASPRADVNYFTASSKTCRSIALLRHASPHT